MRVTSKQFYKSVERLQDELGVELETNVWHRHYSIYTRGGKGSCQDLLVTSDTARDAVDQVTAILNALYVLEKRELKNAK